MKKIENNLKKQQEVNIFEVYIMFKKNKMSTASILSENYKLEIINEYPEMDMILVATDFNTLTQLEKEENICRISDATSQIEQETVVQNRIEQIDR